MHILVKQLTLIYIKDIYTPINLIQNSFLKRFSNFYLEHANTGNPDVTPLFPSSIFPGNSPEVWVITHRVIFG